MKKTVTIIGAGMGEGSLTLYAKECISNSELIIGAGRIVKRFEAFSDSICEAVAADRIAARIQSGSEENIAVLMSGDCGFYSGAAKLIPVLERLDGVSVRVVAGISSPVFLCSQFGLSWHDMKFVSLHGRKGNIVRNIRAHEKTFFLLGGDMSASEVCKRLCDYGMGGVTVFIGQNMDTAYSDAQREFYFGGTAQEASGREFDRLCSMIAVNTEYEGFKPTGIDDARFERGGVPMTKSVVRAAVISRLRLPPSAVVWDIGCGTGSVSVEAAIQCEDGTVYAVDRSAEAAELTVKNSRLFGCDNIVMVNKDISDALPELPAPDCVFYGGGGSGRLREVTENALEKNPETRFAVTAVTLETLTACMELFEELGIDCEVVQIAVTRTEKTGNCRMLRAENPVFLISGERS